MWLAPERRRMILDFSSLLLIAAHALAQPDSSTSTTHDVAKPPSSTPTAEPTCESRTVNYITHTLPQQCLTTSPSPYSTPEPVSATVTSSAATADSTPSESGSTADHGELDADGNDLSTGAFMSFEEWKAMMLEKSGQEALEPRHRKTKETHGEAYPGEDFDSLGDEGEVTLDFDAYSDKISEITSSTKLSQKDKEKERQVEKVNYDEGLAQGYRSKDAGKTSKERFSYASFDAGATVKKASPGAKNPKSILVENKDSYMLLECSMENKFVIVELSDDILVDTVVLANFEFFSSMIRQFRVSVSDRYPVKLEKWKVLGTFEARNSRDIQPFLVENPQIWAKYVRIEILSHYGNEYYCPVSLLRVHGTRMLDSWKEADPADLETEEDSSKTTHDDPEATVEVVETQPEEVEVPEPPESRVESINLEQSDLMPYWDESYFYYYYPLNPTCSAIETEEATSTFNENKGENTTAEKRQSVGTAEQTTSVNSNTASSGGSTIQPTSQKSVESGKSTSTSTSSEASSNTVAANSTESVSTSTSSDSKSASETAATPSTTVASPSSAKTDQPYPRSKTAAPTSVKPPSPRSTISKGQTSGSPTAPRNKTTTTTSSTAPSPTIQDSFFKALNKRIQALESNTTLSLQYIESQSRFLQEALARLERRQVAKVDLFLDTLNNTVFGELREARVRYDQIWQSTVIALESQREQSERQIVALSERLGVLADEVVFQKRMAIVQSLLLLGCLVLVIFSRGGIAAAAVDSAYAYYPTQFLSGASPSAKFATSPLFSPSTPRGPPQQQQREMKSSIHDHSPNTSLLSVADATPPTHLRHSPNRTPESSSSSLRHRPRRGSRAGSETPEHETGGRRRPSPSRTSTDPASARSFFRAPATPSSMEIGYDSEPALTPIRNGGGGDGVEDIDEGEEADYYPEDGDTSSSYPETPARKSERQMTPGPEIDGVEYISLSSRPPLTHSTSARKPLPALPEDPD